jgi:hypothetical protein
MQETDFQTQFFKFFWGKMRQDPTKTPDRKLPSFQPS